MLVNTIYKTYAARMQEIGADPLPGSLEINGGTVNIYFSNLEAEPDPNEPTEYTLDPDGPYSGVVEIAPAARWIVVATATGTPTLREFRVIAPA